MKMAYYIAQSLAGLGMANPNKKTKNVEHVMFQCPRFNGPQMVILEPHNVIEYILYCDKGLDECIFH